MVVIAQHRGGALVDQVHDGGQAPVRIGAIADIIAEQNVAFGALCARLRQAGLEGLTVGVDICKDCDQHKDAPDGSR